MYGLPGMTNIMVIKVRYSLESKNYRNISFQKVIFKWYDGHCVINTHGKDLVLMQSFF